MIPAILNQALVNMEELALSIATLMFPVNVRLSMKEIIVNRVRIPNLRLTVYTVYPMYKMFSTPKDIY